MTSGNSGSIRESNLVRTCCSARAYDVALHADKSRSAVAMVALQTSTKRNLEVVGSSPVRPSQYALSSSVRFTDIGNRRRMYEVNILNFFWGLESGGSW